MDYTDLERVKRALGNTETADDTLLAQAITAASRNFDLLCTHAPGSDDYFTTKAVVGERLRGWIDNGGTLHAWAHTAHLLTLAAVEVRATIADDWQDVQTIDTDGYEIVAVGHLPYADRVQVKATYTGGLGGTVAELPADLVWAVTVLAVRLYREIKSGLADVIGVAEIGILQYTKAVPVEVQNIIDKYQRTVGW